MEKRFKHRKTKEVVIYKDGVWKQGRCCVDVGHEPSNEFWEDVTEYYEILSFYSGHSDDKMAYIFSKTYNGLYSKGTGDCDLNHALRYWNIYSVKRLSDKEIFTVGDKYEVLSGGTLSIESFEIFENDLRVNGNYLLSKIKKAKTPLFTTEDGVDLYGGEAVHWVHYVDLEYQDFSKEDSLFTNVVDTMGYKIFAEIENAAKYIEDNTKKYSRNEIETVLSYYTEEAPISYIKRDLIKYLDSGK